MQFARIDGIYTKDPTTGDLILHAHVTDEIGKPMEEEITIRLSKDALQKLIRDELPTEEKRIQEVLDSIHEYRTNRILNVKKIDERMEILQKQVNNDFQKCTTKLEIMKVQNSYRVQMALLTQKRHLSKFAIQEESELSLQLAKLQKQASEE